MAHLEHVNVTVRDPDAFAAMLGEVFGWQVRWSGEAIDQGRSVHVGDRDSYVALYAPQATLRAGPSTYVTRGGLNHIGVVVDDLDATEERVAAAGFTPHAHGDYEPGRRFYFDGPDGVEIEVVSYG
ncbi:MAG: VOC family protein [Pseudomonadota bacterium]